MASNMKIAVISFPDLDGGNRLVRAIEQYCSVQIKRLYFHDKISANVDVVMFSNGFEWIQFFPEKSLRIIESILNFAEHGKIVIGFNEGFALLCYLHLLPGYFKKEESIAISSFGYFKISNANSILTHRIDRNYILRLPVLMYGYTYYATDEELVTIRQQKQILFHFCDNYGRLSESANIFQSIDNISGVSNDKGNVCGMLAFPAFIKNQNIEIQNDSRLILQSILSWNVI